MSLILDALNRSRREEDTVPGLATQHYAEPPPGQAGWRRMLPWAGLCVALAVIAWLLLRDAPGAAPATTPENPAPAATVDRDTRPAVRPAARPAPPASVPTAAPGPVPEPRPARPPAPPDPEVAALYRQPSEQPAPDGAVNAAEPEADQTVAPPAPAPREEAVDIAKLVEQAESELKNRELDEHAAPFLVELSQHTKDQIPTIFYQRHDYAGDSKRSTVVLNGKQLEVGGTAAPGVKVVEILPDSVVLSHDGREFRLRALNSWINL